MAEQPDQSTLEGSGRIWVSDRIIDSARSGFVVPAFSFLRFENRRVEDGFLSVVELYFPNTCVDYDSCADRTSQATFFVADYTADGDHLVFSNVAENGFTTLRQVADIVLRGEAVLPLRCRIPARLEDGALVVDHPRGARRYLSFDGGDHEVAMAFALALELSLLKVGDCIVPRLHELLHAPKDDLSEVEQSFLALAEYGRLERRLLKEHDRIKKNPQTPSYELPQADQEKLRRVMVIRMAARIVAQHESYEGLGRLADPNAPTDAELKNLVTENSALLKKDTPEDQASILEEAVPLLRAAYMSSLARRTFQEVWEEGNEAAVIALVCPR
ncbi:hypothetical protein [Halovulum sp. GXIMD14793]